MLRELHTGFRTFGESSFINLISGQMPLLFSTGWMRLVAGLVMSFWLQMERLYSKYAKALTWASSKLLSESLFFSCVISHWSLSATVTGVQTWRWLVSLTNRNLSFHIKCVSRGKCAFADFLRSIFYFYYGLNVFFFCYSPRTHT